MNDSPLIKWFSIITATLTALVFVGGVWWYFQDEKLRNEQWFVEDTQWNISQLEKLDFIISTQADIKQELSIQRQLLIDIREFQSIISDHSEDSFEELEVEHQNMTEAIWQSYAGIFRILGKHEGLHEN